MVTVWPSFTFDGEIDSMLISGFSGVGATLGRNAAASVASGVPVRAAAGTDGPMVKPIEFWAPISYPDPFGASETVTLSSPSGLAPG